MNIDFRYVRTRLRHDIETNRKLRNLRIAGFWSYENITDDSADLHFCLYPMESQRMELHTIAIKTSLAITRYFRGKSYVFNVYFVLNTLGKYTLNNLLILQDMLSPVLVKELSKYKKD